MKWHVPVGYDQMYWLCCNKRNLVKMALHIQHFSKRFTTPLRILNHFMINAAIHVQDVSYCFCLFSGGISSHLVVAGIYFLNASCWIYHCFDCSQGQKLQFTPTWVTAILCTCTELHRLIPLASSAIYLSISSRDGSGGDSMCNILDCIYVYFVGELLHDETRP